MASFNIGPLPGKHEFGAVVTGLTTDMLKHSQVKKDLHDLWIDKGVVVFRDVEGLDLQLELSAIFGEPAEHPLLVGIKNQPRTHHVIADINYAEGHGDLYIINGEEIGGYLPWHSISPMSTRSTMAASSARMSCPSAAARPASSTRSAPMSRSPTG